MKTINRQRLYEKLFAFDVHDDHQESDEYYPQLLHRLLHTNDTSYAVLRPMLLQRLTYWLRAEVVPTFWEFLEQYPTHLRAVAKRKSNKPCRTMMQFCATQLTRAMAFAEEAFAHCVEIASVFDSWPQPSDGRSKSKSKSMVQELKVRFRCITFEDSHLKERFQEVLIVVFSSTFLVFQSKKPLVAFDSQSIRELLFQLEWMHIAEPALLRVLDSQVRQKIQSTCSMEFDRHFLHEMEDWACMELLPWLDELMQTVAQSSTEKWKRILLQHVLQEFGNHRIAQLFEIIKVFPESLPALEDLRRCLDTTAQHSQLIETFRRDLVVRLLQPGANTSEILDIYVSTIKAFRLLDPKGVMLEAFSEPVKEYLRNRKDTVRCIISSLTDDQNGDLFEELRRNSPRLIQHDNDSDDDEDIHPDEWEPDPIEADPTKTSRSRSSDDILRILVNIYGSKELFVNEYRLMLADKLLQNVEFNTDRDVQTLELLKLRFGEDSLQQCEIMVRDVDDSKRINANIQAQQQQTSFPLDATIVSSEFWPPFQGDDFALHPSAAELVEMYRKAYQVLRNPRSLNWNASLGSVQITIELNQQTREFTVSPIQATIIMHFADQDQWAVSDLATTVEISEDLLLKHATLWINQGILSFASDQRTLVAATSFSDSCGSSDAMISELETAVSSDAQAEEDLRTLETYIVGMLSNFGSLSIQRIHNMLSTFARSGAQPYNKTISGLAVILGKLVDAGKLEQVAGQYQLIKRG